MKYKTSFYIMKLVNKEKIDLKTIAEVDKEIKKLIDQKISFEVYSVFTYFDKKLKRKFPVAVSPSCFFEFWHYDAERNVPSTYNLRRNKFYKRIKQSEKRLRPTMLRYGL